MSIRRACGVGLLPFVALERASFIHILLRKFRMKTAQEIAVRGWNIVGLRDELYIQLCKQTSDNKKADSLTKGTLSDSDVRKVARPGPANRIESIHFLPSVSGWELLAICLCFFPPSPKFQPYLDGYIYKHQNGDFNTIDNPDISHYAKHCHKKLERICQV